MITSILIAAPLVAGHGKVTIFTGDRGGNGTALGIKGAVVADAGQNYQTETDTTIFWSKDINTDDDFGFTQSSNGNLGMKDLANAMALSGSTVPQVSQGGSINATLHVVTSDGAGPFTAIVDPTASGKFSSAVNMEVTTQVPGDNGWIDTTPSAEALAAGNGKIIERSASRTIGQKASRTMNKRQTATLVDRDYVSDPRYGTQMASMVLTGVCRTSRLQCPLVLPALVLLTDSQTSVQSKSATTTRTALLARL